MYKDLVYADDLSPDFLQEVHTFLEEWGSEQTWIEVYTSGSTGTPKKTILQKANLLQSALATGKFFNFRPNTTILLSLSPKYIAGKLMIVRAIAHSMKLFVAPNQENPLLNLNQESFDFFRTSNFFGPLIKSNFLSAIMSIFCPHVILSLGKSGA